MRVIILALFVLTSSLAIADVTQISDDTFVIRRSDKGGIFGNTAKMRDKALREADEFAKERGKVAETVTISERGKGFMRFAEIEYTFRLVDANSTPSEQKELMTSTTDNHSAPPSYIDELKALATLRDDGILTEEEFQKQKTAILSRNSGH